jgi:hypothetical protein
VFDRLRRVRGGDRVNRTDRVRLDQGREDAVDHRSLPDRHERLLVVLDVDRRLGFVLARVEEARSATATEQDGGNP